MDQKNRAQLLRERFKSKFPVPVLRYPPAKGVRREPFTRWATRGFQWAKGQMDLEIEAKWAQMPDPVPKGPLLAIEQHRKQAHALTTIARKLAVKPKRWA